MARIKASPGSDRKAEKQTPRERRKIFPTRFRVFTSWNTFLLHSYLPLCILLYAASSMSDLGEDGSSLGHAIRCVSFFFHFKGSSQALQYHSFFKSIDLIHGFCGTDWAKGTLPLRCEHGTRSRTLNVTTLLYGQGRIAKPQERLMFSHHTRPLPRTRFSRKARRNQAETTTYFDNAKTLWLGFRFRNIGFSTGFLAIRVRSRCLSD